MNAAQVLDAIAPFFNGRVRTCEVCEHSEGWWIVRAKVQPADKRRTEINISETGDTREDAIARFIEGALAWASIYKCPA